ncbi:MAG: hypothetical protein ACXABU_15285 [Candidatus Hodarchaeales archaeon]|jgi:hypothetical protein
MKQRKNARKAVVQQKDFLISAIGGTIVTSAIIHISYTKILPLTQVTAGFILVLPAIYIGLINEEIQDSMLAMVLSLIGSILLIVFARIIPALIGVFPSQSDLFAYQQIAETLPLFFLMFPLYVLGTMFGVIINEFVIKSRY